MAAVLTALDLHEAHAGFVTRCLVRLGAPRADLDDLRQEVFLTAHRRGGFVVGEAKPTTWLAAIAVRVLANHRRSRQRKGTEVIETYETLADPRDTEAFLDRRDDVRRVYRALATLTEPLREAFVLFEIEGLTTQEIAEALEVPVGTVYSRLGAARVKFAEALETRTSPSRTALAEEAGP